MNQLEDCSLANSARKHSGLLPKVMHCLLELGETVDSYFSFLTHLLRFWVIAKKLGDSLLGFLFFIFTW